MTPAAARLLAFRHRELGALDLASSLPIVESEAVPPANRRPDLSSVGSEKPYSAEDLERAGFFCTLVSMIQCANDLAKARKARVFPLALAGSRPEALHPLCFVHEASSGQAGTSGHHPACGHSET